MVRIRAPAIYFTQSGVVDSDGIGDDEDSDDGFDVSSGGSVVKALTALQGL